MIHRFTMALAGAALLAAGAAAHAQEEAVAAKVNGVAITQAQLQRSAPG